MASNYDENSKKWNEDLYEYEKNAESQHEVKSNHEEHILKEKMPVKKMPIKIIRMVLGIGGIGLLMLIFILVNMSRNTNEFSGELAGNDVTTKVYEINKPIEVKNELGEVGGMITVKSARVIEAEVSLVEVTYEKIEKEDLFYEETNLCTFDGQLNSSDLYNRSTAFKRHYVTPEMTSNFGISELDPTTLDYSADTTLTVRHYYTYIPTKEKVMLVFQTIENQEVVMGMVDLTSLIKNGGKKN